MSNYKNEKTTLINMKLPQSWADITIKQYQLINMLKNTDDPIERMSSLIKLFTNEDIILSEINSIFEKLQFLFDEPKQSNISPEITIENITFKVCFMSNMLTAGQYIDLTSLCKSNIDEKIHSIMAVLCIKKDEKYLGYTKYEKLFYENMTMDKVFPITSFFLQSSEKFYNNMIQSLEKNNMKLMKKLNKTIRKVGSIH